MQRPSGKECCIRFEVRRPDHGEDFHEQYANGLSGIPLAGLLAAEIYVEDRCIQEVDWQHVLGDGVEVEVKFPSGEVYSVGVQGEQTIEYTASPMKQKASEP